MFLTFIPPMEESQRCLVVCFSLSWIFSLEVDVEEVSSFFFFAESVIISEI